MHQQYPFLRDPKCLSEIRLHKWLESENAGREIGFATAAVDWIKRFGPMWLKCHKENNMEEDAFIERRKFRRTSLRSIAKLIKNEFDYVVNVLDVSVFGILFETKRHFVSGDCLEVRLEFSQPQECCVKAQGSVERITSTLSKEYKIFLKFNKQGQEDLKQCQFLWSQRKLLCR